MKKQRHTCRKSKLQNCFIYRTNPVGDGPKNVEVPKKKAAYFWQNIICAEEVSESME